MNIEKIKLFLEERKQPKFRLEQIMKAIYQDGVSDFSEITNLPKNLREELVQNFSALSFEVQKVLVSQKRDSIKALLKLHDGNLLETVLISPKDGLWSACVSSQVGCPLACAFCATGKSGFKRNLTAEEISDQVLFWKQYLKEKNISGNFSNIVYMGMGEPFLNFEEVAESLRVIMDSKMLGFGARSISVSTAGVMDKILEFSEKFPQVNLALSLHSANDEKRSQLMPINKKYGLDEIQQGLKNYLKKHKRKLFIEYLLIDGVNDSRKDASELVKYLKSTEVWYLLHVNLIRYNETSEKYRPTSQERVREFAEFLKNNDINVTVRRSLGDDICGACGQLAGRS